MSEDKVQTGANLSRRGLLSGGVLAGGAALAAGGAAEAADGRRATSPESGPAQDRSIKIDKTYRALVRREVAGPAKIETVRLLPFGGRQALVRLTAYQCCYTDTSNVLGGGLWGPRPKRAPLILGHAGVGVVEAIGPEVKAVRPGDKVIVAGTSQCGLCYNCIRGRTDACLADNLQAGPICEGLDGAPISQVNGIGGLSEYLVNYEERLVPYFSDLPDEQVAMMVDVGSTGLGMTCTLHPIESGSSVVVIGGGPIGLSAVQGARIQGARKIIVVEPIAMRRALALKLGATDVIDPNRFEPGKLLQHLREMTAAGPQDRLFAGGLPPDMAGPDYVIEGVGHQRYRPKVEQGPDPSGLDALKLACDLVPTGGYGLLSGGYAPDDNVSLNATQLTIGSKTLISCQNGGIQTRRDLPRFLKLVEDGKFDAKALISKVYRFDDVVQAYQDVADRTVIAAVVKFG